MALVLLTSAFVQAFVARSISGAWLLASACGGIATTDPTIARLGTAELAGLGTDPGDASTSTSTGVEATNDTGTSTGIVTSGATEPGTSSSTGEPPTLACGWDPIDPAGYYCGGDGEDPAGVHDGACPGALVEGEACPESLATSGIGCCDAAGDAWFCTAYGTLARDPCNASGATTGADGAGESASDAGESDEDSSAGATDPGDEEDAALGCAVGRERSSLAGIALPLLLLARARRRRASC